MDLKSNDTISSPSFAPIRTEGESTTAWVVEEYEACRSLFRAQPVQVQRFIETQARMLAEALMATASHARFSLPDRLVLKADETTETALPVGLRHQALGGLMKRLRHKSLLDELRLRLDELETSTQPAVAKSSSLLRYTTASVMVRDMLPAGRSVRYLATAGEEIPSQPVDEVPERASAITAATDAIAEEGTTTAEAERGDVQVPFTPSAQRFFLPQWVAFDEHNHLLVHTTAEAEAHLASTQNYLSMLHAAVSLAPFMLADETYQQKRYGILGQLVNQGRALARFEVSQVVETIRRRVADGNLNRGLSLSLDFFDDQDLVMKCHDFDIIPAGRIMFVPAFVVLAARKEQAKVEQDTRLNQSTRSHLMAELHMLEEAFISSQQK